ncbi:transmembrane protein, putative (macronuclear) [Tetrahymena thermophila SB210]|uniref:Transmembrane protein, putative n=1 Tax=Tetrahymena thermophila (strain SB210) TaxID=312017 RepID=W7XH92_TETTS|nr:transmembrane protein, putative [Tetrahymena thermophila SB210]EWS76553.1 transmembrane protein, putative [Tetrahymena thermophila SB210]|eukprot:XP_012650925.1 transmembrane protein, putative [Tetrahymena thermophila SB210]
MTFISEPQANLFFKLIQLFNQQKIEKKSKVFIYFIRLTCCTQDNNYFGYFIIFQIILEYLLQKIILIRFLNNLKFIFLSLIPDIFHSINVDIPYRPLKPIQYVIDYSKALSKQFFFTVLIFGFFIRVGSVITFYFLKDILICVILALNR